MKITVNTKAVGKLRAGVEKTVLELDGAPKDTRSLITLTVGACAAAFSRRAQSGEVLRTLTDERLTAMADQGKISFGSVYGENAVDLEAALANALQCFEDGIYRIFVDGKQLERLDEAITLDESSELTFVRLTMLTGRLW